MTFVRVPGALIEALRKRCYVETPKGGHDDGDGWWRIEIEPDVEQALQKIATARGVSLAGAIWYTLEAPQDSARILRGDVRNG